MIRQIQTLLEEGIKEKMTFAKVSIQGTIEKLQALQKDFSDPPFFSQFARNILYRKMALQIIEKKILPAFNVSLNFPRIFVFFLKSQFSEKAFFKIKILYSSLDLFLVMRIIQITLKEGSLKLFTKKYKKP